MVGTIEVKFKYVQLLQKLYSSVFYQGLYSKLVEGRGYNGGIPQSMSQISAQIANDRAVCRRRGAMWNVVKKLQAVE